MSLGQGLQVTGGILEFLGLVTVMLGIAETRRAFTDRPSLVAKLVRPFRRLFRRGRVIEGHGHAHLGAVSASGRGTVRVGWQNLTDHEAIERLQEVVDRHEDMLAKVSEQVDRERTDRESADRAERTEREALRQALEHRISEAAAGGLTLETWGAALFAVGILFATVGAGLG